MLFAFKQCIQNIHLAILSLSDRLMLRSGIKKSSLKKPHLLLFAQLKFRWWITYLRDRSLDISLKPLHTWSCLTERRASLDGCWSWNLLVTAMWQPSVRGPLTVRQAVNVNGYKLSPNDVFSRAFRGRNSRQVLQRNIEKNKNWHWFYTAVKSRGWHANRQSQKRIKDVLLLLSATGTQLFCCYECLIGIVHKDWCLLQWVWYICNRIKHSMTGPQARHLFLKTQRYNTIKIWFKLIISQIIKSCLPFYNDELAVRSSSTIIPTKEIFANTRELTHATVKFVVYSFRNIKLA